MRTQIISLISVAVNYSRLLKTVVNSCANGLVFLVRISRNRMYLSLEDTVPVSIVEVGVGGNIHANHDIRYPTH